MNSPPPFGPIPVAAPAGSALRPGGVAVAAAFGLRAALTAWVGDGLPTFITFYPAVMVVALLAGFGPGLLATFLTGCVVAYGVLPPVGQFVVASPVDRVSLVLFGGMGLFMSGVAALYRRSRQKAAAFDQEQALREIHQEKEFLANLLEHASQPFAVGYPDGRLGRFNQAYAQLTGYTSAELRTLDWSATLTPPEWREPERQKLEELNRTGQPVLYEKEYVRKDGARVPIEMFVHLVRDAGGKTEYYYSFITDITARKQAEEKLRQSEARLRRFYQSGLMGVIYWNMEGQITDANDKFLEMVGYTREDLAAGCIDWVKMTPPEHRHLDEASAQELKATGVNKAPFEKEYVRKDGSRLPVLVAGAMLDEARSHGVALVLDMTARKQAEAALARQREEQQLLLEATPASIFYKDRENRFVRVNRAFAELMGKPKEELEGRSLFDLYPREQAQSFWKDDQEVMASGQPKADIVEPMQTPAGERWMRTDKVPCRDAQGRVIGVIGFSVDVTERKQTETALLRTSERLDLLAETASELLRSDSPRRVVEGLCRRVMAYLDCQAFFNFLIEERAPAPGLEAENRKPRLHLNAWAGIPAETARQIEWLEFGTAVCGCAARDGCRIVAENIRETPDPRTELVKSLGIQAYACHPLLVRGRVLGTLSFGARSRTSFSEEDLSLMKAIADSVAIAMERQQADQALRALNEALEDRVRQRTADLLASNKELEAFCYAVSHDLRAPLRAIDGFSQAVLEDCAPRLDAHGRDHLRRVRAGCQHMGQLIEDLLKLSRLTRIPMEPQPVNLSALAGQIAAGLREAAPDRQVEVRIAEGLQTRGDPQLLRVALGNLLENAWKFTSQRAAVRIEVGVMDPGSAPGAPTPSALSPPPSTVFFVRDNGVGFDMAYADKLFAPFQRLHGQTEFPGLGIGLATVQRVILRHGGRIWVEAAPDKGATFYFTLNPGPA